MSYNTCSNVEDLNIVDELHSFEGVSFVAENHQIGEEEYRDADYQIFLVNDDGLEDIKKLLDEFFMSAYIEKSDDTIVRHN